MTTAHGLTQDVHYLVVALIALAGVGVAGISGWILWRRGLWKAQDATIKLQQGNIESLMQRVNILEGMQQKLEAQVHELEKENASLKGEIRGKQESVNDAFRAAVASGGCDDAFVCPARKVPGEHLLKASNRLSAGGTD